jgi:hypothetical protein
MNRVIRAYSKLSPRVREEVYNDFTEGNIERISFPYQGKIVDGIIYNYGDFIYLIPISTIIAGKAGSSEDLDDDDDDDDNEGGGDDDLDFSDEE